MTNAKQCDTEEPFLQNLRCGTYKQSVLPLEERVLAMQTVDEYLVAGTATYGCQVFRIVGDKFERLCALGEQPQSEGKPGNQHLVGGSTCTEVSVSKDNIVYIKEHEGEASICIHKLAEVLKGVAQPCRTHALKRRAPMVVDHKLSLLIISAVAWKASWTTGQEKEEVISQGSSECDIRVLDLETFTRRKQLTVADNAVSMLRLQTLPEQSLLGVADSRTGLRVYDLRQEVAGESGYALLYHVPVEEVRNFQLVGDFVGVFHKFEPNVSFWNMKEQKTILCINIQEQMRKLAEQRSLDTDDDGGVEEEDCGGGGLNDDDQEDHVTAVTSVRLQHDYMLLYGTRSGCLFGMAVDTRTKVFSIPFPHTANAEENRTRKAVHGLCYVPDGQLVSAYEGHGITLLDFNDQPHTKEKPK